MLGNQEWRSYVAFWMLGLINNFTFVLLISAAEDILIGYAGIILSCTVIPGFLGKLVFSSFADRLPYSGRVIAVAVSSTVCCLLVALASSISLKLSALVVQSAIGSLGEISFLALTAKYSESVVGAWSSGTGAAGIAGAGFYIIFRETLHFDSKDTLAVCAWLPLTMIVIYFGALRNPASFQPLPTQQIDSSPSRSHAEVHCDPYPTRKEYFPALLTTYMLPLGSVYFCEYAINQGVLGTLTKFADGKTHTVEKTYSQLQFVYQMGVFVSRSSIKFVRIRPLWVLAVLQAVNLVMLTIGSMFSLVPSLETARILIFWEGLLGGSAYVNAFFRLRTEAPAPLKEWALATASVADATGISVAALVSIWLEQGILKFRDGA